MTDLFDYASATAARDEAMEQVLANAGTHWRDRALAALGQWRGERMTGEDIRLRCAEAGIVPHHPNAWGAFIMHAVRVGALRPLQEFRKMRSEKSHARITRVYAVQGNRND